MSANVMNTNKPVINRASPVSEELVWRDDVIKWKHFPRYWPFVRGIHRSTVNSPHKGQWRGALMFSLMCARINIWVNNREAGDLRRYRHHYDVIVMNKTNARVCYILLISHIHRWYISLCTYFRERWALSTVLWHWAISLDAADWW